MYRRMAGLSVALIALALPSAMSGSAVRTVAFLMWSAGVLLILDGLLGREGLPAQLLWGVGTTIAVGLATGTEAAAAGFPDEYATPLWIATAGLAAASIALPRPKSPMSQTLHALREKAAYAALPERTDNPESEIARMQAIIAEAIGQIRSSSPEQADVVQRALRSYQSEHGTDTVATSPRPIALRNAADVLVEDLRAVRARIPVDDPGHGAAVLAAGYAERMVNLVAGRTRG